MRKSTIILGFGVLQLVIVEKAHAYIDLSVGSMLIQGLIAALVSIGFFWRVFYHFWGGYLAEEMTSRGGRYSHDC